MSTRTRRKSSNQDNIAADLEAQVLGGVLVHGPDFADQLGITGADFGSPDFARIYSWLRGNRDQWHPGVGALSANTRALDAAGLLERIAGGPGVITDLVTNTNKGNASLAIIEHAARQFLDASLERQMRLVTTRFDQGAITGPELADMVAKIEARRDGLDGAGDGQPSRRDVLISRLYDPDAPVPEPDYRVWIKGLPMMSAGNVSALVSNPKAGKSSVIVAVIAAACGSGEYLGLRGDNKDLRPVVHLDTEQSRYHHDQKLRTVQKRLGADRLPSHVASFRLSGERLGIEHVRDCIGIAMEHNQGKKPYIVLLDGGVDFINDPNDADASFGMVRDLMAVADEFDCVVLVSLHFNPAPQGMPSKGRGHYGSENERKAETYLTIKKDAETGHRALFATLTREKELPEADAVRFAWDAAAGMFEVLGDTETGYSVDNVLKVLHREGDSLTRKHLKELLVQNYRGDARTWETRISTAHKDRLVCTSGKPPKVCLTKNGKCRLETVIDGENGDDDGDPF